MSSSLKILHICPRPSYSGLEDYAHSMAKAQKELGLNIEILVLANSPLEAKARNSQILTLTHESAKKTKELLIEGIQSSKWDILHLHSTQDLKVVLPALMSCWFKSIKRPKLILQTHILISHTKKDPIHWIKYMFVDEMWCSSRPSQALLEKYIPIKKEKIRIVRYGRDIERIQSLLLDRTSARDFLKLPQDAIVCGLVSRIDSQKGILEFLEASISILKERSDFHLVIIGGRTMDDPASEIYQNKLFEIQKNQAVDVARRIHFLGQVPESFKYLRAFDLYALPSYNECFALSVLESQLAGVPVLGTNAGGTPDIVIDNQTGWLFETRSSQSAEAAIKRALQDSTKWPEYARKAQERVVAEFDFNKIMKSVVDLYIQICHKSA